MFRHLRRAKRAGRGQDPQGIGHTKVGELAVECPACPIPGKNLPEGWEDAPVEMQYVVVTHDVYKILILIKVLVRAFACHRRKLQVKAEESYTQGYRILERRAGLLSARWHVQALSRSV